MNQAVISTMRAGGYKQAVALADRTLFSELGSVRTFTDVAMHASNAASRYARTGRMRLSHTPLGQPVIQIVTRTGVVTSPAIQQLLLWVEPREAMDYLRMSAGIGEIVNIFPRQECPF